MPSATRDERIRQNLILLVGEGLAPPAMFGLISPFMPISLLLDKEIGERKRAKGLVSEIHRLSPWNPFSTIVLKTMVGMWRGEPRHPSIPNGRSGCFGQTDMMCCLSGVVAILFSLNSDLL